MIVRMRPDPDISKFLNEIAAHPVLSRADERALVILAQAGNKGAARKLCAHNLKFVIQAASKYQGAGLPFKDLIHEGVIGLTKAIYRYNPATGNKLISYAVWWVRQSIVSALSETSRTVRISVEHEAPIQRLKKTPLRQFIGGLYLEDVENEVGKSAIRPEFLEHSLNAFRGPLPIDRPIMADGTTQADIIPSPAPQPDQLTEARERADILNRLRGKLKPQQREIIALLYGLDGGAPLSLRDVGIRLNLSSERIRQIKEVSLRKMKHFAKRYEG